MKIVEKLKKIKGDASFREFYRNKENKSIVVISKKEKLKNLLIYDAINKGIILSTGEIIALLHSDDIFADDEIISWGKFNA